MLQTHIWRQLRIDLPRVAPTTWWRRHRGVVLPQLGLVFGVLLLLCGALWAVGQHADHQAEVRVGETNRFLDEFASGPVATAWQRLRAAWEAERARQDALLARIPSLAGSELHRTLRDHQQFVLETVEEYRLDRDIEVVHHYLRRLATCVRVGVCDRHAVAAQLGPALQNFRDQHRYYFDFEHSGVNLDRDLETIVPPPLGPARPGS
jgi:hypothetical protein